MLFMGKEYSLGMDASDQTLTRAQVFLDTTKPRAPVLIGESSP